MATAITREARTPKQPSHIVAVSTGTEITTGNMFVLFVDELGLKNYGNISWKYILFLNFIYIYTFLHYSVIWESNR